MGKVTFWVKMKVFAGQVSENVVCGLQNVNAPMFMRHICPCSKAGGESREEKQGILARRLFLVNCMHVLETILYL